MLTSVVIPAFNHGHLIEATLATIYAQTLREIEIVVVDDGSTDDTERVLRPHLDRVRYLRQENSGGAARPRNTGIRASRGACIAIFDADDLMAPDKLERQTGFLARHPEVDFVFTDFVNVAGDRRDPPHTATCPLLRAALPGCRVGAGEYVIPGPLAYEILLEENFIGGSATVFRRSLVERIGGFDERTLYSEDRDFSFRAARAGAIGFLDVIGHRRRLHPRSMTVDTESTLRRTIRLYQIERGRAPRRHAARIRRRLAELNLALAWHLREQGCARRALGPYLRAIAGQPGRGRAWGGLARCLGRALFPR
jgi:glycosyltransferase involved in cell wall biosynthesis